MAIEKRILSCANGLNTWFVQDTATGEFRFEYEQDVQGSLNAIKQLRGDGPRAGKGKEMWHVAEIPNEIALKWMIEEGVNIFSDQEAFKKVLKKKLNDPDYAYLRVAQGRV